VTAPTSALPAPPPADAARRTRGSFFALYELILRNQVTVGRMISVAALGALAVLLGIGTRVRDVEDSVGAGAALIDNYGLQVLAPVVCLVFASSALGDLVDDKTLVYLWLRPTSRFMLAAAASLAALTVCLPAVAVPLVLAAAISGAGPALTGGTAVAAAVGVAGYVGMFTALGIRFRRALVWGLAYILLWEGFVANASKTAGRLSLRGYTRSVLSEYTGVAFKQASLSLLLGILVPLLVGGALVVYAGRRLSTTNVD
jgi:ABC-2 type transport system permease protein